MAAMMSSLVCVGDCTTDAVAANDTTPMRVVEGCRPTNALAASCAATSRLAGPLARSGKGQIGFEEIVVGQQLEGVDPGHWKRRAEPGLALLGGGREAPPEAAIVSVDEQLLARLGILDDQEPEVRQ